MRFYCTLLITKTYPHKFDPIKPHFYIVKLRFTGVNIIFLIFARKHRLWVLVRTEAVLTSTYNLCFEQNNEKYQFFFYLKISYFVGEIYLNRRVFVMCFFCDVGYCAFCTWVFIVSWLCSQTTVTLRVKERIDCSGPSCSKRR